VLGTLLIQGLTLKPLLRALNLRDGDPVAREEHMARQHMLEAAYAQLPAGRSRAVDLVRKELKVRLGQLHRSDGAHPSFRAEYDTEYRAALRAARQALLAMRDSGDIGDDAFHTLENELDWMEVSDPLRAANADATR
jgi:monovalent cation/hydrogen antiporter